MKRIGNLYFQIISIENLNIADEKAQKGKQNQYGVKIHNKNKKANILSLHQSLIDRTYRTSEYSIFKVYEPKEREVYRLPYFPDRVMHHAIMNIIEPIFISVFTSNSYSCIKGKGIHATVKDFKIVPSKFEGKGSRLDLQIEYKDEPRVVFTGAKYLIQVIEKLTKEQLPFKTKIIKIDEHLEFS